MINSYSLSYFLVSGLAKKTRNFQIQSFRVYWDVNIANSKFIHLFKKVLYTCCTQDTSLAFYLNVDLLTRRRQWHPTPVLLLENPMDGGAWWAAVHGVAKSRMRLSDFTFTFHFHAVEKEMATHSSVLAWRIPGTGEPPGLPSMGSHRVGHDWSDLAAAACIKMG